MPAHITSEPMPNMEIELEQDEEVQSVEVLSSSGTNEDLHTTFVFAHSSPAQLPPHGDDFTQADTGAVVTVNTLLQRRYLLVVFNRLLTV